MYPQQKLIDMVKDWLIHDATFIWKLKEEFQDAGGYLCLEIFDDVRATMTVPPFALEIALNELKANGWKQCQIRDAPLYFLMRVD